MRLIYLLLSVFLIQSAFSAENILPAPKPVTISLEISNSETKKPIIGAKVFFFDDQQTIRSNTSGIATRMMSTVKDIITVRISAQGFASEIVSIPVNAPLMNVYLKLKDIILDDVFVQSDASRNGLLARSLENVQLAAIFEGKKTELINMNQILSLIHI